MAEVWARTQQKYKLIEKILEADSHLCTCVNDIENNGVRAYLQYVAFKIRYPGITTGNDTFTKLYVNRDEPEQRREKRSPDHDDDDDDEDHHDPFYGFCNQRASQTPDDCVFRSTLQDFDFNRVDSELLEEVATQLVDKRTQVMQQHLDSPESWEFWKKTMKESMSESGYFDLAVFMFCRLN